MRHVLNLFKQSDLNDQNAIDWEVVVFVDSVLHMWHLKMKDKWMSSATRASETARNGGKGHVLDGLQVFQDKLDTRELQELFEAVEVNVADAQSLFKWGDLRYLKQFMRNSRFS